MCVLLLRLLRNERSTKNEISTTRGLKTKVSQIWFKTWKNISFAPELWTKVAKLNFIKLLQIFYLFNKRFSLLKFDIYFMLFLSWKSNNKGIKKALLIININFGFTVELFCRTHSSFEPKSKQTTFSGGGGLHFPEEYWVPKLKPAEFFCALEI